MKEWFLRLVTLVVGAVGLLFASFMLVRIPVNPDFPIAIRVTLESGLVLMLAGFLVGAWQGWRLLGMKLHQQAFTAAAVAAIGRFKWAAFTMTVGAWLWLPWAYRVAQHLDAPGVVLITGAATLIPLGMTVFLAVLQQLWRTAVAR